jgi:hypothetical protein
MPVLCAIRNSQLESRRVVSNAARLRELLGERRIARHPHEEGEDRTLIAPQDLFERGIRAGQRLRDEPGFRDGLEVDRDRAPSLGSRVPGVLGFQRFSRF